MEHQGLEIGPGFATVGHSQRSTMTVPRDGYVWSNASDRCLDPPAVIDGLEISH